MLRPLRSALVGWVPRGGSPDDPLSAVMGAWAAIVGEPLALAARPIAINDDTLIVATESSAWSEQLAFLEPKILAALHDLSSARGIRKIRFRTGRRTLQRPGGGTTPRVRPAFRQGSPPPEPTDPADPGTLEKALERLRVAVERAQDAKRALGWKPCSGCGVALSVGTLCAPCAGGRLAERSRAVQRLMYDAPWLGYSGIGDIVDGLTLQEYETLRHEVLARWWALLLRVRAAKVLAGDGRERQIASSYVLLHTGWAPDRITPAVVRNLLGDELHALLYDR